MIQIGAVASENSNLTTGATSGVLDHSYSRYQKSNDDVRSVNMSFDDVVDMLNPLQHIPVLSSVYRAIAGETMNPVSRIAGDTLYGGVLGLASAGVSAIGAIGDEVFAANNDGKSASATMVAALFGSDDDQDTQLASTASATTAAATPQSAPTTQVASLQTPALQSPILQMPKLSIPAMQTAAAATTMEPAGGTIALAESATSGTGMPLDRSKLAYGGVMDSSMMASAQQNQTLALAMAGRQEIMQAEHNMRNSRFATAAPPATPTAIAATLDTSKSEPKTQAAMQNLIQELQSMKGVNQYKNATQITPIPGGTLNTVN